MYLILTRYTIVISLQNPHILSSSVRCPGAGISWVAASTHRWLALGRPPLFICSGWLENWTLGTNSHLWAGPKRETSPAPPAQPSLTCTDLVQINNILLYIIVLQISCNSISVNSELVQFVRGLQKQKYYLDDFNFIGVWKNCFKKYWR